MPSKQDVQQLHFPPLLYKIGKMFPRSSISCVKMSLMCYSTKYKETKVIIQEQQIFIMR